MITLPRTSPYTAKDQAKADVATCFIGRGSPASSTEAYRKAFAEHNLANKGSYRADDIVFVSVEGARSSRKPLNAVEVRKAAEAGAHFVADNPGNRNRPSHIGERELAALRVSLGYVERPNAVCSTWHPTF